MPNHFHALVGIDDRPRTIGRPSYLKNVVAGFKAAVSQAAARAGFSDAVWQRNYHERIVRNQAEWDKIAEYIYLNPVKWEEDRYFRS